MMNGSFSPMAEKRHPLPSCYAKGPQCILISGRNPTPIPPRFVRGSPREEVRDVALRRGTQAEAEPYYVSAHHTQLFLAYFPALQRVPRVKACTAREGSQSGTVRNRVQATPCTDLTGPVGPHIQTG
jgi:hypothetical protein